ncbi:hypothetical protein HJC23_001371 [Cyclotella cryptica]|uniref:Uncharacterized protein n=1 Tax=Cyclotella cryptica TaxID=29204 RepID=A0ABD3NNZ9_9STRA|eukprot:CCRYP_020420-RA/>CCRYP_020420-RA protein AED:0.07 eAED:0.08 QI:0/0/0/1/1/1/2/0/810
MTSSPDDDSSSSSSDSILDASPVITRKDGRAQRAEKLKMDFFDECLDGANARANMKRRIAVVEREQLQIVQDQNRRKDEERGTGETEGVCDRIGDIHITTKCDSINVNAERVDGKENTNNQTNSKEKTSNQVIIESEDSYWARVDQFAQQNSTVKGSSHNRPSTQKNLASAHKRLGDAMDRLEYGSETDDEEGQWKNGRGMTWEQRKGEATAKLTGGQSSLGLRRVFGRRHQRTVEKTKGRGTFDGNSLRFYWFQSRHEALTDLMSVLAKLNEVYEDSQTISEKLLHHEFILPLSRLLKTSKQNIWGMGMCSLFKFLKSNPVISSSGGVEISCGCRPKCTIVTPDLFIQWLWKVSCSSLQLTEVEATCCKLVIRILQEEPVTKRTGRCHRKNVCNSVVALQPFNMFCMGDLAKCLVNDFGLWMGPGSIDTSVDPEIKSGLVHSEESSMLDIYSLRKLLMLWNALLEKDYVLLDDVEGESVVVGEGATRDLVALARTSLDPHFELATQRYTTDGDSPSFIIQQPLSSLVDSAARQIAKKFDQKKVHKWLENSAISIIDSLLTFSAGDGESADSDDEDGHLPLATAISNILSREMFMREDFSYHCALMKLYLTEKGLKVFLRDIDYWDDEINSIMHARCESWGVDDGESNFKRPVLDGVFRALCVSEVAFIWIEKEKEYLLQKLPFFLASVHIAGECVLASTRIFCRTANPFNFQNANAGSFERYTAEEKELFYETLSSIEDLCDSLRAECGRRSVISFPHLRRAKEHLARLSKFIGGVKGKSSKEKRQKRRAQGSLDCFFRSNQDEFNPLE